MECWPESPEGVALVLFFMVLSECPEPPESPRQMLDLYAECLRAAEGERSVWGGGLH